MSVTPVLFAGRFPAVNLFLEGINISSWDFNPRLSNDDVLALTCCLDKLPAGLRRDVELSHVAGVEIIGSWTARLANDFYVDAEGLRKEVQLAKSDSCLSRALAASPMLRYCQFPSGEKVKGSVGAAQLMAVWITFFADTMTDRQFRLLLPALGFSSGKSKGSKLFQNLADEAEVGLIDQFAGVALLNVSVDMSDAELDAYLLSRALDIRCDTNIVNFCAKDSLHDCDFTRSEMDLLARVICVARTMGVLRATAKVLTLGGDMSNGLHDWWEKHPGKRLALLTRSKTYKGTRAEDDVVKLLKVEYPFRTDSET